MDLEGGLALVIPADHVALALWPQVGIAGIGEQPEEVPLHEHAVVHEAHLLVEAVSKALDRLGGIGEVLLLQFVQVPQRDVRLIAAQPDHILRYGFRRLVGHRQAQIDVHFGKARLWEKSFLSWIAFPHVILLTSLRVSSLSTTSTTRPRFIMVLVYLTLIYLFQTHRFYSAHLSIISGAGKHFNCEYQFNEPSTIRGFRLKKFEAQPE